MNLEQFPAQQHHISGGGGGGGPSEKNILGWESAGNITKEEVVEAQGGTESSTPFLPYMPPVKQPCCRAKDKDGAGNAAWDADARDGDEAHCRPLHAQRVRGTGKFGKGGGEKKIEHRWTMSHVSANRETTAQ